MKVKLMDKIKIFFIALWVAICWEWHNARHDNWIRDYFYERERLNDFGRKLE